MISHIASTVAAPVIINATMYQSGTMIILNSNDDS